jgi:hypothetical protein
MSAGVARAASIDVASASGVPGSEVTVTVSLRTMGAAVEGTQNRIDFDRQTAIAADEDGQPACSVNPAIDKNGTAFRFLPLGCDPAVECTAVRAFVIALDNLDPIPDNSRLYSCRIRIAGDAGVGTYALRNSEARASGALGATVPTTATDGAVEVVLVPHATIEIGSSSALPGATAMVGVTLALGGESPAQVAMVQNDIEFAPQAPIAAGVGGSPACTVNAAIDKSDTTFEFQPTGCTPAVSCSAVRARVAGGSSAIPDGALLYTCAVAVPQQSPTGIYPLVGAMPMAADVDGDMLAVGIADGSIAVVEGPICVGDCDADDTVAINELLVGVNIAIGRNAAPTCPVFDADDDGRVAVSELVQAVNNALTGC